MATKTLIGTRGVLGGTVVTGGRESMSSMTFDVCYDCTNLRVAVAGARTGTTLPSAITYRAAIWKSGTPYQALWGGISSVAADIGEIKESDAISGLSATRGERLTVRCLATLASGTSYWSTQYLSGNEGDGLEIGTGLTDKTMSGTVTALGGTTATQACTVAYIVGDVNGETRIVAVAGDSRSIGQGDISQIGFMGIALQKNLVAYFRFGQGGSTADAGLSLLSTDVQVRATILNYGVDRLAWQYGVNNMASGTSAATIRSTAISAVNVFKTMQPGGKAAICTILPVTNAANTAVQSDAYWNSTKEAVRVAYNTALRAGLPAGFDYLWDCCGDASGATAGVFPGAENTLNGGLYRQDVTTQNGFTNGVNDGLHPGRPICFCGAAALDVTDPNFLGLPAPVWGPEIAYASIPASGEHILTTFYPSWWALGENPQTLTNITATQQGVARAMVIAEKVSAFSARLFAADAFFRGQTVSLAITAGGNLANLAGAVSPAHTIASTYIINSSTYDAFPQSGTGVYTDTFTRADTVLSATTNNTTAGTNLVDQSGNTLYISGNKLAISGSNSRKSYCNIGNYLHAQVYCEFDPANFLLSGSPISGTTPFAFKIGLRYQEDGSTDLGSVDGVFLLISRGADLNGTNRASIVPSSSGSVFGEISNALSVNWANGTTYGLKFSVIGTAAAGTKKIQATILNVTAGTVLGTVQVTSLLSTVPNEAGRVAFISSHKVTNDASASVADTVMIDNLQINNLAETTAPTASAVIPAHGLYTTLTASDSSLPILPATGLNGFSLSRGGTGQTLLSQQVYGGKYVRLRPALAAVSAESWTWGFSGGNGTDSLVNNFATASNQAITNNSTIPSYSISGVTISKDGSPITSITLTGEQQATFTAAVGGAGSPPQAVTWSMRGEGSVTSGGVVTAPGAGQTTKTTYLRATAVDGTTYTEVAITVPDAGYGGSGSPEEAYPVTATLSFTATSDWQEVAGNSKKGYIQVQQGYGVEVHIGEVDPATVAGSIGIAITQEGTSKAPYAYSTESTSKCYIRRVGTSQVKVAVQR